MGSRLLKTKLHDIRHPSGDPQDFRLCMGHCNCTGNQPAEGCMHAYHNNCQACALAKCNWKEDLKAATVLSRACCGAVRNNNRVSGTCLAVLAFWSHIDALRIYGSDLASSCNDTLSAHVLQDLSAICLTFRTFPKQMMAAGSTK